uniref:Uncharacterized protein n=1 Tax=Knipowitschia caucasica TaxID=637954 RepID=A0AAV2L7Z2_KNICA
MPLPSHFRIGSVAISNSTYRHPSAQEGKLLSGFTRSARSRVAAGRCLAACYHGHWLKVVRGHVSSLTLYIVLMSPTYGGSDSSPGGGKLQPPDVRSQTSGGEGTGSSTHRAAQEQAAPNLIAPCPKLDVTIFGMVVPQRGILVVKEPFRQQASDGIRLAPPLWQRALQHCHRMESQTLQPERGVAKVRGTVLLEPLDDCQSLQQGLLISPAMVNIHQARPGTPLPNEVQLAIKCTSVATQCAMSVIPERSTDDVKVLQQADPAIAPVLAFIQRQCAPGRMEREALDPAARSPTSGQLRPRVMGWTPTSPTYGQPCPQLTVWTTTKTLYSSDSRPAS